MKRLVFSFLLFFAAGCSAASIDVQASVPSNTVWSFSVTLPNAGSFDEAKIFFDGSQIAKIRGDSGIYFPPNSIERSRIFSNTEPIGSKVYFLVSPFEKGTHNIELRVDGEKVDEDEVHFFEIYDSDETADLQSQINSVRGGVNSLIEQFNGVEERLGESLTQEDRQQLQQGIDSVLGSVQELETAFMERSEEQDLKISVLLNDLELMREGKAEEGLATPTGFASFQGLDEGDKATIILLAVVVVAAILVVKFKDRLPSGRSLYGKQKKAEPDVFSKSDARIAGKVMEEAEEEAQKGKWAFGEGSPKPSKAEKRFNVGDLLKK